MTYDKALVRALHRLVHIDKLLTREDATRYCAIVGIPISAVDELA